MSRKEAVAKVERAKKEQIYYGGPEEYGEPLYRWNYDIETVEHVHGIEEAEKITKACSITKDEWRKMWDDGLEPPDGMKWVVY